MEKISTPISSKARFNMFLIWAAKIAPVPRWCRPVKEPNLRRYHAGLSSLRRGFKSRPGHQAILMSWESEEELEQKLQKKRKKYRAVYRKAHKKGR